MMLQHGWSRQVLRRYENVYIIMMIRHDVKSDANVIYSSSSSADESLLLPFEQGSASSSLPVLFNTYNSNTFIVQLRCSFHCCTTANM